MPTRSCQSIGTTTESMSWKPSARRPTDSKAEVDLGVGRDEEHWVADILRGPRRTSARSIRRARLPISIRQEDTWPIPVPPASASAPTSASTSATAACARRCAPTSARRASRCSPSSRETPWTSRQQLKAAVRALDRAGEKGILHRNNVNRRKSRLTAMAARLIRAASEGGEHATELRAAAAGGAKGRGRAATTAERSRQPRRPPRPRRSPRQAASKAAGREVRGHRRRPAPPRSRRRSSVRGRGAASAMPPRARMRRPGLAPARLRPALGRPDRQRGGQRGHHHRAPDAGDLRVPRRARRGRADDRQRAAALPGGRAASRGRSSTGSGGGG